MYQYSNKTIYQNICLIILFLIQILPRSYPKCYFCFLFCFLFKVIAYIHTRRFSEKEPIAKRNTLAYLQIHSGTALPTIHFILLLILQRKEGGVGCLGEEPNPTTYYVYYYLLSTQNDEKILSFIMEYIDHKSVVLSSFTIWIHICILV